MLEIVRTAAEFAFSIAVTPVEESKFSVAVPFAVSISRSTDVKVGVYVPANNVAIRVSVPVLPLSESDELRD